MPGSEFNVPSGAAAVVKVIDSTANIGKLPAAYFMSPAVEAIQYMPTVPAYSFLVQSSTGRKILFDLGVRKDVHNHAPVVAKRLATNGWEVTIEKNVIEILNENNVDGKDIDGIIWSHWHWDHVGDPSTFPQSTDLIVGPGFKKAFLPGAPTGTESPILESDYDGRNLVELDFTGPKSFKIGRFNALDYFGDGSFYVLDSPGHAIGHLCGLARTTTDPDTFIFMAGDAIHHGGELRPSEHLPIPKSIDPHPVSSLAHTGAFCPGEMLDRMYTLHNRKPGQPFFVPAMGHDIPEAIRTIGKVQDADCNQNVFVIFAHDDTVRGEIDLFPKSANGWKEKGWAEKTKWRFLKDFAPALGVNK